LRFDSNYKVCEDYKLWSLLILQTEFYILQESLVKYRIHNNGISKLKKELIADYDKMIKTEFYKKTLKINTIEELENTFKIFNREKNLSEQELEQLLITGQKIIDANNITPSFTIEKFQERVYIGLLKSIKKGIYTKEFLKNTKKNHTNFYKFIPYYLKVFLNFKAKA
jgi:hypothetical protein